MSDSPQHSASRRGSRGPAAPFQIGALQRALAELSDRLGDRPLTIGTVLQPTQRVVQHLAELAETAVDPLARLVDAQREWADQMAAWAELQRQLADRVADWAELQRQLAAAFELWLTPAGVVTKASSRVLHTLASSPTSSARESGGSVGHPGREPAEA